MTRPMPDVFVEPVTLLANLEQDQFVGLVSAIREFAPTGNRTAIIDAAIERASLAKAEVGSIVRALIALSGANSNADSPRPADDLADFVSGADNLEIEKALRDRLRERLVEVFSVQPFTYFGKASLLVLRNAANYVAAEIATDARPVFARPEDAPVGFIINHQLLIEVSDQKAENDETFEMAMDFSDLLSLRKVVNRAIAKHKAVEAMLQKESVVFLPSSEAQQRADARDTDNG